MEYRPIHNIMHNISVYLLITKWFTLKEHKQTTGNIEITQKEITCVCVSVRYEASSMTVSDYQHCSHSNSQLMVICALYCAASHPSSTCILLIVLVLLCSIIQPCMSLFDSTFKLLQR